MRSKKQVLFFACIVLVLILFFVFPTLLNLRGTSSIPHRNLLDTKISQYSDKHITPNAVATNLEFKNIAFDTNVPEPYFFQNQIATVIRAVKFFASPIKKEDGIKEYGSWIWTPIMRITPEYTESILSDAKADGVNTIYISIDSYLDIFVMKKGGEREKQKDIFSKKLEYFINSANQKGIEVDAEAGWRNWAEGENIYKAFAVVNYVKNFNETHQNKFRGFQYDVEPYLLDSYKKDTASVLKNFVKLVDQTEYFLATSTLRFSVVIPDFYDKKDGMTPKFLYNGKKDFAFGHLLSILDKKQNSSIIIMSYRNFAEGEDGAIEITKNEMQTANSGKYKTKIIIAQETGDVPPPYITFHDTSKKYLTWQIEKINTAFNPYSNFGGIAIHYANALVALK